MNIYISGHLCGDLSKQFTRDCDKKALVTAIHKPFYVSISDNSIPQTPILYSNVYSCVYYIPLFNKPGNFLHLLSLMEINRAMEVTK